VDDGRVSVGSGVVGVVGFGVCICSVSGVESCGSVGAGSVVCVGMLVGVDVGVVVDSGVEVGDGVGGGA
jgi:hypothetical protein